MLDTLFAAINDPVTAPGFAILAAFGVAALVAHIFR